MSDQITIRCPHCHGQLSVDESSVGEVVSCPHCSGRLTVPGARLTGPSSPEVVPPFSSQSVSPESQFSGGGVSQTPVPQAPVPQAPVTHMPQSPVPSRDGQRVSPMIMETLTRTKGWVRFFSILGFIACGFLVLAGLVMLVNGSVLGEYGFGDGFYVIIGLLYLLCAALYFFPSLKLTQYANRIVSLQESHAEDDLVRALDMQRSFWAMIGIMAIVTISLYLLMLLIFIVGVSL